MSIISNAQKKITPNCRYGHGDLNLMKFPETNLLGYVIPQPGNFIFTGNLYLCHTCGYTEFFDNDTTSTINGIATITDATATKIEYDQET